MKSITLLFFALFFLPNFVSADCDLTPKFSYKTKGLEVNFNNQSMGSYSEVIWNFGDGTKANSLDATHKYATAGEYNFSVTVKTVEGCSSTYESKVYVFDNSSESKAIQSSIAVASVKSYPEPFSGSTNIEFSMEKDSKVDIGVYDLNNKLVKTIANGNKTAGKHLLPFNAENIPAGVYIVRMEADGQLVTHKITVQ